MKAPRTLRAGRIRAAILVTAVSTLGSMVEATAQAVHRDSAGVSIVTNSGPAPRLDWRLSQLTVTTFGGLDAPEKAQLWRVGSFLRAPDGGVVALSAGHREVRVFAADGSLIRSFGRAGQGPGEFVLYPPLGSLAIAAPDTVLVLHGGGLDTFLLDGTLVQTQRFYRTSGDFGPGTATIPSEVYPDHSMAGTVHGPGARVPEQGVFRPTEGFASIAGLGAAPILLRWYKGIEQQYVDVGSRQMVVVGPFARHQFFAAGSAPLAKFVAGDTGVYELHVYDSSGALRRIIRRQEKPEPVRREWIAAWEQAQAAADYNQDALPELRRAWAQLTMPETLPAIDAVTIDTEGFFWVLRPTGDPAADRFYEVFGPTGELRGSVTVPAGLLHSIHARPVVGVDYFLGLWIDDVGVESLRLYALEGRRPSGAPLSRSGSAIR